MKSGAFLRFERVCMRVRPVGDWGANSVIILQIICLYVLLYNSYPIYIFVSPVS
jgi:hypothetical protein